MVFTNLGQYLKKKRGESGLTQRALADKLKDVHSQFISNWERELCGPPEHCLENLIRILKLDRNELFQAMMKDSELHLKEVVYPKRSKKIGK